MTTTHWSLKAWIDGIGRSRKFWYSLTPESKPLHTRTGKLIVVLESPEAWLERMRLAGGAVTVSRKPKSADQIVIDNSRHDRCGAGAGGGGRKL